MVSIVPHINTLVIDIGSEYTRVGYTGDFTPFYREYTNNLCSNKPVVNSVINDVVGYVNIVQAQVRAHSVDNIILIEHTSQSEDIKLQVLKLISERNICNGLLFIKSSVCDAFGHGKISCLVINCSAGSCTASIIQNGAVVEYIKIEKGGKFQDEIVASLLESKQQTNFYEMKEAFISEVFGENQENSIFGKFENEKENFLKEYNQFIDGAMELRKKYNFKKNTASGSIILSGGVFKNQNFFRYFKEYIVKNYAEQVNESIFNDEKFEALFAGASIFGSNNFSKALFITPADYFKYKEKIFAIKSLSVN